MNVTTSSGRSSEDGVRDRVWLGAILLVALGVRLWGIDFGLPNEHARPDERHLIGYTLTMGGNRLNPGFFNYPSLYLYVLFVAYGGYFALGRLSGRFASAQDLVREYALAPEPLYLIDRVLVALIGTLTVAVVYWIGKRLAGRRVGLVAAFFLSVAYLHVRDSHFGTVDVPVAFVATLAVAFILRAHDRKTLRSTIVAGFVSGLAVSTKYNAIALLAPLAVLHGLEAIRSGSVGWRGLWKAVGATALALVLGFVTGTPFALLDSAAFLRDAGSEVVGKMGSVVRPDLGPGWLYHLRVTLPVGLGLPLLVLAGFGVVVSIRRDWRLGVLAVAFPAAWFVGVGMSRVGFLRYCVPLVPMACVFGAWALDACVRKLALSVHERWPNASVERASSLVLALLVAATVTIPLYRVVMWNRLVSRADTRVLTREWIEANVSPGASIGLVGSPYMRPELWSTVSQLRRSAEGQKNRGRGLRNQIQLEHVERTKAPAYELYFFDGDVWRDTLNLDVTAHDPPAYVVMIRHPLLDALGVTTPKLGSEYTSKASFIGYEKPADSAVYDPWDAFFLPYARFTGVSRPGPNFEVFRKAL